MQWQTDLPLIAILRGITPGEALAHVGAVIDAGFDAVEGKSRNQRWNEKVAVAAFRTRKRKNPAGGLGFFGRTAKSSGYPARMWGSGRRAREVMPDACRAALLSCWKSVSFMVNHLCMRPGPTQGAGVAESGIARGALLGADPRGDRHPDLEPVAGVFRQP